MNVLSLFDGISCARVALERMGFKIDCYFASEIDEYATDVSKRNYGDIFRLGSVVGLGYDAGQFLRDGNTLGVDFMEDIDLMIGGSPCQDLSIAKKDRKGLDGEKSGLFWEYLRLLKEVKPKYFILENVASMSKEARAVITREMGVEPIMIDASLVSAQSRKRLFWTNIPNITLPEDRGIYLKDILESGEVDRDKSYCLDASYYKGANWKQYKERGRRQLVKIGNIGSDAQAHRIYSPEGKSVALSALGGGQGAKTGLYLVGSEVRVNEATKKGYAVIEDGDSVDLSFPTSKTRRGRVGNKAKNLMANTMAIHVRQADVIRKLTPVECERLQSLPDNYTQGISNTQRYKCLGNGFNVEVIAHILSFIPKHG